MRTSFLLVCATIALLPARAQADARELTARINACFKGDPAPCINQGMSDEFRQLGRIKEGCGVKPAVRVDEALIADDLKNNKSPLAEPSNVFMVIADLCSEPTKPGAKEEIAARLKSIHFTLIPMQPRDATGANLPKVQLEGTELTVGSFYEAANYADTTAKYLQQNVLYEALMRARTKLLDTCYAGDPDPCLQANLGQIAETPAALQAACGVRPAIHLDEAMVRILDKANIGVAAYVDEILRGLTTVCKDGPSGKARVARSMKSVRFSSSPKSMPKDRNGIVSPSFHRNGGEIVVTNSADCANVETAAQEWAAKNL